MESPRVMGRRGFTLIELLIAMSIIAILISLLMSAVQAVRESGNRLACQNNVKQLILATHHYHDHYRVLPTYNGIGMARNGNTTQAANAKAVYGSWFVHLMPFVEQGNVYMQIANDVARYSNTGSAQAGGALISPAVPGQWVPPPTLVSPAIPATFNQYRGSLQWVGTYNGNGYIIYTLQWVPPRTPDPGTGVPAVYDYSRSTFLPGTPAVYAAPGPPGYIGPWRPDIRQTVFSVLLCPSEMTKGNGTVYDGAWGATNYLANFNALTNGNPTKGYQAAPQRFANVTDGLSNTIFFGEAYGVCEGRGRTALIAWHNGGGGYNYGGVHNLGLTYALTAAQRIDIGNGAVTLTNPNGFPNPSQVPNLNFMFQVRPSPTQSGMTGCNSMTGQTPHKAMNIALGDGSVRSVSSSCTSGNWLALMLPSDGNVVEFE